MTGAGTMQAGSPGDDDDEAPLYVSPETSARLGGSDPDALDDWSLAVNFAAWKKLLKHNPRRLERMRRRAITGVIRRAKELLRRQSRPTEVILADWSPGTSGELDVEETIERAVGKSAPEPEDLAVTERRDKRADLALALDVSLSMAGENLALVAVAAAVLALRADPRDLAVVAFETTAETLTHRGEAISPEDVVRRILDVPAGGFTNIEAGLLEARKNLSGSRSPRRAVILVSDGKSTEGGDPRDVARGLPRLHVVHIGRDVHGRRLSRALASLGKGAFEAAPAYRALPRAMDRLTRRIFR